MTTTFIAGQSVIVDAYDGPLSGTCIGTRHVRRAFTPDGYYLRIRIEETSQGYAEGEVIDALPQRVTAA